MNGRRLEIAVSPTSAVPRQVFFRVRPVGVPVTLQGRLGSRELAASEQEVVDYVLHAPRAEEQRAIEDALIRAQEVWPLIAAHDMQAAMLRLHTKAADGET